MLTATVAFVGPVLAQPDNDVVVTTDTTWTGLERTVHDLVVRAPATLRLEGTSLRVEDHVLVEAGATMDLGPSGGRPTDVGPAGSVAPSQSTGFWMTVNGTLLVHGTPLTELHGIRGSALDDMFSPDGGIQVNGNAILSGLHLHDGNSTLIVREGGSAVLKDSLIERMGFLGVGVYGALDMANSTLLGSDNGIMGVNTCDMKVRGSRIEAPLNGISDNNCRLDAANTAIVGGANGLYLSGGGNATLADMEFTRYSMHGIFARGYPGEKKDLQPHLTSDRVVLDALGAQTGRFDGLTLQGAVADLRNTVIRGNTGFGILEKDRSTLHMSNVTVVRNALGLFANGAYVDGDVLQGNDFGLPGSPDANRDGQVSVMMIAHGLILDQYNRGAPGGTLKVFGSDGVTALVSATPQEGSAVMQGSFPAYARVAGGHSLFLGPFTYELSHPALEQPVRGAFDLSHPYVTAQVSVPVGASSHTAWWQGLLGVGPLAVGGALVVIGLAWKPIQRASKGWRSARSK